MNSDTDGNDIIKEIISPFDSKSVRKINEHLEGKIEIALNRLSRMGKNYNINASKMKDEIISAKNIINEGLSDFLDNDSFEKEYISKFKEKVDKGIQTELSNPGFYEGNNDLLWKINSTHSMSENDTYDCSTGTNGTLIVRPLLNLFLREV